MQAVEYALEKQDTNLFWQLHSWTNVPPRSERIHKDITSAIYFKQASTDELTFRSFRLIQPAPPRYNKSVRFPNGGENRWNIPVTGIITFRIKEREVVIPGTGPSRSSVDAEGPFGISADGNYWLAVLVGTRGTNPAAK